jgi:hypothetical protein
VGDCYVAAAGVPELRKDHAVAMARFARDCLFKMKNVTTQLEKSLGPDTGDLGIRIGMHSGPVTAGVLRGERARFQLFGDTMNTTARIETTGMKNMIHLSEETAQLLKEAGKENWIRPREDMVIAKGKGELTTYWLNKADGPGTSHSGSSVSDNIFSGANVEDDPLETAVVSLAADSMVPSSSVLSKLSDTHLRLVKWNVEVFAKLLREVVQHREALEITPDPIDKIRSLEEAISNGIVLDEVEEVIALPAFDSAAAERQNQLSPVELSESAETQLHTYFQTIAALYRENDFHNFEHASHVAMSVVKLLSRVVAPNLGHKEDANEKTLHDYTYGVASDPLTQLAVVFSALIHDVDHQGVANTQLVKENGVIAAAYQNKSVAEQNSVDVAWNLLMDESFTELRRVIYTTESEFRRFRQLTVNAVMATDIVDKDLGNARKVRWEKAFSEGATDDSERTIVNRKATIVIEHMIQASDVAHTMQHWHIYRKWNIRLFEEMSQAYRSGRAGTDPAEKWYESEIGFFDFYIIPLAKKLKDCGVFGVSSDEYLNYALKNRREWEVKGKAIVAEMVEALDTSKDV